MLRVQNSTMPWEKSRFDPNMTKLGISIKLEFTLNSDQYVSLNMVLKN